MARKTVVRTQMRSRIPSMTPKTGIFGHNPNPPFTHPHSVGGGGIPVKFQEVLPGAVQASRLTPTVGPGVQQPFGRKGKK